MRVRWGLAILMALVVVGATAQVASADDTVTPLCNGQACSSGWYTSPVFVSWSWTGGTATSGCSNQDYLIDTSGASNSCTVQFPDGSITRLYVLKLEVSPLTTTVTPARPPDSNGWYNHPVAVSFAGSGYSGTATCTPAATTYSGPATAKAVISSTCIDPAGKTANPTFSLNYDDTPPTITGATPSRAPDSNGYYTGPVTFQFTGVDAGSGIAGCDAVTYGGPASGSVVGGCHDQAGNYATLSVPVNYQAPSPPASTTAVTSSTPLAPATKAKPRQSLPILRWKRARHATYYNVQIFRGKKKILSTWPAKTSLRLRRSWKFDGHRFRLKPGHYRWYVWPGYGSRKAAHYGHVLVSSTFKVSKPA